MQHIYIQKVIYMYVVNTLIKHWLVLSSGITGDLSILSFSSIIYIVLRGRVGERERQTDKQT